MHLIVNFKTLRIVLIKSFFNKLIIILKNTRLSIIRNGTDNGYYVGFWKSGITALIITVIIITLFFITLLIILNYFLSFNVTLAALFINAEFNLTLIILTIISNPVPNPEIPKVIVFLTFRLTFISGFKILFLKSTLSLPLFIFFIIIPITNAVYNIIFNLGNYKRFLYIFIPLF